MGFGDINQQNWTGGYSGRNFNPYAPGGILYNAQGVYDYTGNQPRSFTSTGQNGAGYIDSNQARRNPYAQGGPLFGQGYGRGGNFSGVRGDGYYYVNGNAYTVPPDQPIAPPAKRPARSTAASRPAGRMFAGGMSLPRQATAPSGAAAAPQGAVPEYTSAIDAGPVWAADQLNQAIAQITGQTPLRMPTFTGVTAGPETRQQLADIAQRNGLVDALAFSRAAAKTNADQLFNSQSARAQAGLAGGGLLADVNQTNLTQQAQRNSSLMQLISALLGSI